VRSNRREQL